MNRLLAVGWGVLLTASVAGAQAEGPMGWRDDGGPRVSRDGNEGGRDHDRGRSAPESSSRSSGEPRSATPSFEQPRSSQSQPAFTREDWPRDDGGQRGSRSNVHGVPEGRAERAIPAVPGRGAYDSTRYADDSGARRDRSDYGRNDRRNDYNHGRNDRRDDRNRYGYRDYGRDHGRNYRDDGRRYDYSRRYDWDRRGWDRHGWRRHWHHGWNGHRYRAPTRYYYPRGYSRLSWSVGFYLPAPYYARQYYVDYRAYGLAAPPWGCSWVRADGDLLLVDLSNGEVLDVLYEFFY